MLAACRPSCLERADISFQKNYLANCNVRKANTLTGKKGLKVQYVPHLLPFLGKACTD